MIENKQFKAENNELLITTPVTEKATLSGLYLQKKSIEESLVQHKDWYEKKVIELEKDLEYTDLVIAKALELGLIAEVEKKENGNETK